ncbi:MAG: DUF1361 domain-containing protein [Eggerthellaceae bacterium]|nr:DUF1361 domain-containing protein [Eggerthellaceae bacterium]
MDHSQEVEYIGKILKLEEKLKREGNELRTLKSARFREAPAEPKHEQVQRTYPATKSTEKWNVFLAFGPLVFSIVFGIVDVFFRFLGGWWSLFEILALIWIPVYYFAILRPKRKANIAAIEASPEWKAERAKLDAEFDAQQSALDQRYFAEKEVYDNKTLPAYKAALEEWTAEQDEKIRVKRSEIDSDKADLDKMYVESQLVPQQFRSIDSLRYIYQTVSTSSYNVQQAIAAYEKHLQRELDAEKIKLENEKIKLADEQNYLLAEQNEIAEKARRDANIAAVASTYQRHKTNKTLDKIARNSSGK